jgi:uncharacterized repeat protein (TIGR01451 family)
VLFRSQITGWVTVQINSNVLDNTLVTTLSHLTWDNQLGQHLGPVDHSSTILVRATPQLNSQLYPAIYAFAGENVVYNGTLQNASNGTALNTVLIFQLNTPQMSFVSASQSAIVTTDNVTFNLGSVPAGTNMSGSMTVHIDGSTPDGTVLQIITLLSWKDAVGNSYGPQVRYYDITVYQRPQLTITKEGSDTAVINANYTFTGTLTNVGSGAANNITLIDYLPEGMSYVGSSHSAVYNAVNRTVTWQLGTLNRSSSIPGWITIHVDNATVNGSRLANNFQVTWTDGLGTPYGPISVSKEVTAYSTPQITVTKEGPDEATVGSYITFTGTLTNAGGLAAENVVLVDYLPAGLNFVSSSQSAVYNAGARTVTWNIGHVGSGVAMPGWVTVQVEGTVANGASLTNSFAATWQDGSGNSYGPASAAKEVVCFTHPLVILEKTGPVYGRPGHNLTFTLTATNSGGLSAVNVGLMDSLPTKYSYISSSPPGVFNAGNVSWDLGTIGSQSSRSITLTVLVDNATVDNTPITNTAIATWQSPQGVSYGPTGASATTTIYSSPQLTVSKSGPDTANPSDNCTYSITLTNVSDGPATNVTLNDIVPSYMNFVSCSDSGTYNAGLGVVTWNIGAIAGNGTRTVTLVLAVDPSLTQASTLVNTAMATWKDSLSVDYGPASGTFETRVSPYPALSILLTGPASGAQGTALTYIITITNNSNTMTANNVSAQFMVPSGSAYYSSSDGGTNAGGTVVWNLGNFAPLASRQVTVTIIPGNPAGSQVLSTSATAWQYPAGTIYGPTFSSISTTVEARPDKAITTFNFNGLNPAVTGVINESRKTITLTVPFGNNVAALVPTITITGASVNPRSGAANNFTVPQIYTVTAADGSTQMYTVTVRLEWVNTRGQATGHGSSVGGGPISTPMSLPNIRVESAGISARTVTPGEPVTVTADLTNKSTVNGNKQVTVYVNGEVESVQGITVNSGGSTKLTVNVSRSEPGEYNVYVDGVPAGSFMVSDKLGNNAILVISSLCLLGALFIGFLMILRRRQNCS